MKLRNKETKERWYINENGGVLKYVPSDPDGEDLAYIKGKKKTHTWVVWTDHRGNVFHCCSRSSFEKAYRGYNEDLHKIVCGEFTDKTKAQDFCNELNEKYTCLDDAQMKGAFDGK